LEANIVSEGQQGDGQSAHLGSFDTTESGFLIPNTDDVAVQYGAATHRGNVRDRNEDHYVIVRQKRSREILSTNVDLEVLDLPRDEAYTLIVADGAGGEGFGHLASQLAIRTTWESARRAAGWLMNLTDADANEIKDRFVSYAKLIQQAFLAYTRKNPDVAGMATTWTCAHVSAWDAVIAHVGDSRAYHGRADRFQQITHDHTLAEELRKSGASPAKVANFQNVLTRAFGAQGEEVIPDVHQIQLQDGDALLLCSDGLTSVVDDQQITATVFAHNAPQAACDELVQLALNNGGPDNVTALLLRVFAREKAKGQ
jgi:protein phosphatase